MSHPTIGSGEFYSVAPATRKELFPSSVVWVFERLAAIATDDELYERDEERPSKHTIEWAQRVLLRVVPSYFLRTAEIDVFHGEIHVTWERGNKRVVAFLPSPDVLKLYLERVKDDGEVERLMRSTSDPQALNAFLKWLYS